MRLHGWISGMIGILITITGLLSLESSWVFWSYFILGALLFGLSVQLTKSKLIGWLLLHLSIWVILMAWIPGFQSGTLKIWAGVPTGIVIFLLGMGSLRITARYPAYELDNN